MEETPVLFAPDFSQYKTVADIIKGRDAVEKKRIFDIKCENIKIVNNIASIVDTILKSSYDDDLWKNRNWVYGFKFKNLNSGGSNGSDYTIFNIEKKQTSDNGHPLIRCFSGFFSDHIQIGDSVETQTQTRNCHILIMLADVFGPLASIVQVWQNIECHIRFPEAPDISDEQA